MTGWRWLRFAYGKKYHWAINEGRYYRKACGGLVRSLNPAVPPTGLQRVMNLCPQCEKQIKREAQ